MLCSEQDLYQTLIEQNNIWTLVQEASKEDHYASQQVIQSKNSFKYKSSHPEDQIIGNKDSPRRTRSHFRPEESALGLLSMIEPIKVDEALTDDGWILAMQDELNQFQRNDVWVGRHWL